MRHETHYLNQYLASNLSYPITCIVPTNLASAFSQSQIIFLLYIKCTRDQTFISNKFIELKSLSALLFLLACVENNLIIYINDSK